MKAADPANVRKSRLFLLLIVLAFVVPMIVAGLLSWSGWQPGTRGNGEPILPQRNFVDEQLRVRLADGQAYAWRDTQPRLTLVALAGPECAARCLATLTSMAAARVTLNRNQSRLRLLYLGTPPADAAAREAMSTYWQTGRDVDGKLDGYRPATSDSVGALLVESNGTALSFYPPGFDAAGLLRDMRKVIK